MPTSHVHQSDQPVASVTTTSSHNDTKTVVIAVGASVVLFVIGLILGYLLGHQGVDNDRRGTMYGTSSTGEGMLRSRTQAQSSTN